MSWGRTDGVGWSLHEDRLRLAILEAGGAFSGSVATSMVCVVCVAMTGAARQVAAIGGSQSDLCGHKQFLTGRRSGGCLPHSQKCGETRFFANYVARARDAQDVARV